MTLLSMLLLLLPLLLLLQKVPASIGMTEKQANTPKQFTCYENGLRSNTGLSLQEHQDAVPVSMGPIPTSQVFLKSIQMQMASVLTIILLSSLGTD